MDEIKIGSTVVYKNPFEDEKNIKYVVKEIDVEKNWCLVAALIWDSLNPTYTCNLSDLKLAF